MSEDEYTDGYSKTLVNAYFKLPKETFELFTRSADTYKKLLEVWHNSSNSLSKEKIEPKELYQIWHQDFKGLYNDVFETLFRPMQLLAGTQLADNFSRISDSARLSWPFGAFGSIYPMFKPYENLMYLFPKETPQLFQKLIESYVNFQNAWREYYAELYKAWDKTTEKLSMQLAERMAASQKDSTKPMDFNAFHDLWQETFSKGYIELLGLPNMVSVQTKLSSSTMDVMKNWKDLSETLISVSPVFPFPSRNELDETYKRLHLLRKDLEDTNQRIDAQPTRNELDEVYKSLQLLKDQIKLTIQKGSVLTSKSQISNAQQAAQEGTSHQMEKKRLRQKQVSKQE